MSQADLHDIDFEARIRLRRGQTAEQLAAELVSAGFARAESEAAAAQAVSRLASKDRKSNRSAGLTQVGIGAVLFVIGLGVTLGSLSGGQGASSPTGRSASASGGWWSG